MLNMRHGPTGGPADRALCFFRHRHAGPDALGVANTGGSDTRTWARPSTTGTMAATKNVDAVNHEGPDAPNALNPKRVATIHPTDHRGGRSSTRSSTSRNTP